MVDIYLIALNSLSIVLAIIILISSIDDFFIDIYYWFREIYRILFIRRRYPPLTLKSLSEPKEKWLAIMIPAWQEDKVIDQMIEHLITTIEYSRYMIFIGTYQNDLATAEVVESLALRHTQVVHVNVPEDGPTCKADCLNWIIQAILLDERASGREYAGVIMHDSEDISHPLELKLFNYLLPRKDFIQLPVLSLEREWTQWVAGTYMDDFAEFHQKDLTVRENLTGFVPGAGVASCYSRKIIQTLISDNENQPFNTDSLTEDYDFSFRMKAWNASQVFVKFPVYYQVKRRHLIGGMREEIIESYIATREMFPDTFTSAYHQRARWIIGISLQGWQSQKWRGSFWTKYFLWRDRKGLMTSLVTMLAYFVVVNFIMIIIIRTWYPSVIVETWLQNASLLLTVMSINLAFFINRIGHRMYFVGKLYGWEHAILSVPRLVVNNFINFSATILAWKMYLDYLLTGNKIAWDKTEHAYPSEDQLGSFRRRLGDMLLEWDAIDGVTLETALARQAETGQMLGKLLIERGIVSPQIIADAMAHQSRLPRISIDFQSLNNMLPLLPHRLIVKYQVLPLQKTEDAVLQVGVCTPLSEVARKELKGFHQSEIEQFIVTETDMATALHQIATGESGDISNEKIPLQLLGDVLIKMKTLTQKDLAAAVQNYDPDKDGRLGDYLVKKHIVSINDLERALAVQRGEESALQFSETKI